MLHGFPSTLVEKKPSPDIGALGSYERANDAERAAKCIHKVSTAALDARARGVLFDVGHGGGSFSWTVAEVTPAKILKRLQRVLSHAESQSISKKSDLRVS